MQPVLLGGRDDGLMLSVELDRLGCVHEFPGRQGATRTQCHPRPESPRERQGAAATDLAAEERVVLIVVRTDAFYYLFRARPTLERGSARASIFWLSARRSSLSTFS